MADRDPLFKFDEYLMRLYRVARSHEHALDGGSVGCGHLRFHLHRFQNNHDVAGLHPLAGCDIHLITWPAKGLRQKFRASPSMPSWVGDTDWGIAAEM